jgi:ADP-L-glycero-D-manno-heptose 6-epimerase
MRNYDFPQPTRRNNMIIVTGGAGFIGSAVVWKLNEQGMDDVLVVDNLARTEKWKNLVNRTYRDYVHKDDFLDRLEKNAFHAIEAIVHMGACSSTTESDADFLIKNNFHYTRRLSEYCLQKEIRFISASSAATYGNGDRGFSDDIDGLAGLKPLNMYGYSKHLFDRWAVRFNAMNRMASLKFFNVFGPNEYHKDDMCSMIFKGFQQIRRTKRIRLFKSYHPSYPDGGQRRDFVYVKDCVEVIAWLLDHPAVNGLFNVGSGVDRCWNDLAAALFQAMRLPAQIDYIDMPASLKDKYQYYTRATMDKLSAAGYSRGFTVLEDAVHDYVTNYLEAEDSYL